MSLGDVATLLTLRSLRPTVTAERSAILIRWMLRLITVIIFLAATVIGVQFALAAPTEPPASTSLSRG